MANLSRRIKSFLYSKSAPAFLFAYYFQRRSAENRKRLAKKLTAGEGLMDHLNEEQRAYWQKRIDDVLSGPDNADIPRHINAGQFSNQKLTMHNGLQIDPLSYYNFPLLKMLIDNKGVHEPQEEKIFQEVIQSMKPESNPTMLELGAYWSFYSMWFMQRFSKARCIMVEPDRQNLFYGKENLKLNNMSGEFIHAGISQSIDRRNNSTTVDQICLQRKIDFIDILHSDIQGYEYKMLQGAEKTLTENKVGYIFISTHSNELHNNCRQLLEENYGMQLVASADLDETYSWDGILVMKSPNYSGLDNVSISLKKAMT